MAIMAHEPDDAPSTRHLPFAWRILFWMSVVALGPLVVMAYQGYHCARQAVVDSEYAHLRSAVEWRKARLEAWLGQVRKDFRFLAVVPCARGSCTGTACCLGPSPPGAGCSFLTYVLEGNPDYETIVTYDTTWQRIAGAGRREHHDEDLLTPEVKAALDTATGLLIFPAHVHQDGNIGVHIGRPLFDTQGGKAAYIAAYLNLTPVFARILSERAGLGQTGKVFLASADGTYLSAPNDATAEPGRKSNRPSPALSADTTRVFAYADSRGIPVLAAAAAIPEMKWTVVTEIDQDEAFAWLRVLRNRAIGTGAVTLVVVLFLAAQTSRRLSRPLRELARVATRIAQGRHEERLGRLGGTEAQQVARAFNHMLDELAASHEQLMHAASLAAIGELSSRIVHEMRNPLSSVKINLQALRGKVAADSAYAELADIALQQAARLERMLTDLLGYGKPLELHPAELPLERGIAEAIDLVRDTAAQKGVSIQIEDDAIGITLWADPEQLRRVLVNLLTNAVDAAPHGGTVTVHAGRAADRADEISISVQDNGPGIPATQIDKLFLPFFTTKPGGTGLGLANVKKIIEYHGGTVTAANRREGGAVFTTTWPRKGPPR